MSKVVIHIENGRAVARGEGWGPEDWGKVYANGDPFPCCGCKYGTHPTVEQCGCRCHETSRAFRRTIRA